MVVESEQTGRRHVQPPMSRGAMSLFRKRTNLVWLAFVRLSEKRKCIIWMNFKPAGYWVSEEIRILLRRPYEIEFRFRFS